MLWFVRAFTMGVWDWTEGCFVVCSACVWFWHFALLGTGSRKWVYVGGMDTAHIHVFGG